MDYSHDTILRLQQVINQTGKCRSGIYVAIRAGHFPLQKKIGKRAVGWSEREIQSYIHITLAGGEYRATEARKAYSDDGE